MLIKPGSKRRRSQAEIAMEKDAAELQRKVNEENEQAIVDLQRELREMRQEVEDSKEAKNVFDTMMGAGVIHQNEEGEYQLSQEYQRIPEEQM